MNEAELRPCGGFVTAYGTIRPFSPHLEIKNVYTLSDENFGSTLFPVDKVTPDMRFWDLGIHPDMEQCHESFLKSYNSIADQKVEKIIFVNFSIIEDIFKKLGSVSIGDKEIKASELFGYLTRAVADVDRHDETSLDNRKQPLVDLGGGLIWDLLISPIDLWRITNSFDDYLDSGELYVSGISPEMRPSPTDFFVIEWNLGGAKTSRFLNKEVRISAREVLPSKWNIDFEFIAKNIGGIDEPLSQTWKGVFEFQFPEFLGGSHSFDDVQIVPGELFKKQFSFKYEGNLSEISIFRHRGQRLFANIDISLFPQKVFDDATFKSHENVGHFYGEITLPRKTFTWNEKQDILPPFVTLHEIIPSEVVPFEIEPKEKQFFVEVHFNETSQLTNDFSVTLMDRDFSNSSISENPQMQTFKLLDNNRTLIMSFFQEAPQFNERYYLEISGVADKWGNEMKKEKRTVIDKRKNDK